MVLMISVPYFLEIKQASDILILEKDICSLLQCTGRTCAFFQSADYVALKISIMHALRQQNNQPHFTSSSLFSDQQQKTSNCNTITTTVDIPKICDSFYINNNNNIDIPGSTLVLITPRDFSYIMIKSRPLLSMLPTLCSPPLQQQSLQSSSFFMKDQQQPLSSSWSSVVSSNPKLPTAPNKNDNDIDDENMLLLHHSKRRRYTSTTTTTTTSNNESFSPSYSSLKTALYDKNVPIFSSCFADPSLLSSTSLSTDTAVSDVVDDEQAFQNTKLDIMEDFFLQARYHQEGAG